MIKRNKNKNGFVLVQPPQPTPQQTKRPKKLQNNSKKKFLQKWDPLLEALIPNCLNIRNRTSGFRVMSGQTFLLLTLQLYIYIDSIPCSVAAVAMLNLKFTAAARARFTLYLKFFDLLVDVKVHRRRPCAVHTLLEVKSLLPLSLHSPPAALRWGIAREVFRPRSQC
jgi:hypothetical protein